MYACGKVCYGAAGDRKNGLADEVGVGKGGLFDRRMEFVKDDASCGK